MNHNVISIEDYKQHKKVWKEVFSVQSGTSTIHVYVNTQTCETDVVVSEDSGTTVAIAMNTIDSIAFVEAIRKTHSAASKK